MRYSTPEPCGCVVFLEILEEESVTIRNIKIEYCPLHSAAPKMLKVLKRLLRWRDNSMAPDLDNMLAIIKEAEAIVELVTKESEESE